MAGPRQRVRRRVETASGVELPDAFPQQVVVFTVDTGQAAAPRHARQRVADGAVVQPHGVVYHVHLERRDALPYHAVDFRGVRFVPLGNGHVEAVVAVAAGGLAVPQVERLLHGHAAVLRGKVEHGRRAAEDGGVGAAVKIVCRHEVAERQVEVRVRVDKPGQHKAPGRVDPPFARGVQPGSDGADDAVFRKQVRLVRCAV